MNIKNYIQDFKYSNPEIEGLLEQAKSASLIYAETQGRHDGKLPNGVEWKSYVTKTVRYFNTEAQELINRIRQILLIAGRAVATKETEELVEQECVEIQHDLNDNELIINAKKARRDQIHPNFQRMSLFKKLQILFYVFGIGDGIVTFLNYHQGSYNIVMSIVTACTLALAISMAHLKYVPWIRKSLKEKNRAVKATVVACIAAIIFSGLAFQRAAIFNGGVKLANSINYDAVVQSQPISPMSIAIVSILIFGVVMGLSLEHWPTDVERKEFKEWETLGEEIEAKESENKLLKTKKKQLKAEITRQKNEVRVIHDYGVFSIKRAKNLPNKAVAHYQKVFAQYNPNIPDWFSEEDQFVFDDSFSFTEPQNQLQ